MPRQIEFTVSDDLPPKKDGASSMWAKPTELPRLIALRRAAKAALGNDVPFRDNISLTLEVYCPSDAVERVGDLDNFITGVCDGLMSANPRIKKHPRWDEPDVAMIRPQLTIAIEDDSRIMSITSSKAASREGRTWYRVSLSGDP